MKIKNKNLNTLISNLKISNIRISNITISNITIIILSIINLYIIFILLTNKYELFINPGQIESDTGNIEITDGSCLNISNPEYVAKNNSVCCNDQSKECICKLDTFKLCSNEYDKCFNKKSKSFKEERKRKEDNITKLKDEITTLENELQDKNTNRRNILLTSKINDQISSKKEILTILQESIEEEPVIPPGIRKQCQNEFGKCAKDNVKVNNSNYNTDKFKLQPMKMSDDSGNKICSIHIKNINELPKCINYCNEINNCKGGIYDTTSKYCDLFDKDLVDKSLGAKNGDINYQAFTRINNNNEGFTNLKSELNNEGFTNLKSELNNEGFTNLKSELNNKENKNKENKNKENKNKEKINNILTKIDKKKNGYKTCKSTYNNNLSQLQTNYEFKKLETAIPIQPGFNSEICRKHNLPFIKCKNECLLNDKCDYLLYSSSNDNLNKSKYYKPNNKCVLYSGVPSIEGETIKLSKTSDNSDYSYYIKKIIPIEDRED